MPLYSRFSFLLLTESTIPGSATINIAYAPKADSKGVHGSGFTDFQSFLDDCEMYEGNQKGIIALTDFKVVLADAEIQFTAHELKYISKHFGATSLRDSAAINHLALGEALEMALYLEVSCMVFDVHLYLYFNFFCRLAMPLKLVTKDKILGVLL